MGSNTIRDHRREFEDNRHVYAVVSRRSKGVSIGVNLNLDKVCNFDCAYCQVDRRMPPAARDVDVPRLVGELENLLERVRSSALFEEERFRETPPALRRLNDIAFSGDGEPTTCPQFLEVAEAVAEVRRRHDLGGVKLVLITNASRLHQPTVRRALAVLDANNGEVWAKLDAGTEAYYREVNRTAVPFRRVLANITEAARARWLVIQGLFLRIRGEPPPGEELEAFCAWLNAIRAAGGRIKLVQVYTVARVPAEPWVAALGNRELDAVAEQVRRRTSLPAEAFYGAS